MAKAMWPRLLPEASPVRFWFQQALRIVAIVAGLVSLAGPRFGAEVERIMPKGSDLYVLIDVSRSMLAEDVAPSRLERAKADVSALVNRLEGERIGLIAFAGQAVVKCPLTVDYDSFRRALHELDPSSAPRGGTAIGDAIRKALDVFQGKQDRDQAILLITDGDDQQSYPLDAAAVAAERRVTIFALGLGDASQGARIPQSGGAKSYVEHQGQQVWSKLNGNLLSQIALKTSGVYIPAGTKAYDLGELYAQHLHGRYSQSAPTQQRVRRSERYQIFLAIAFLALLIDLCIVPYRQSRRARENAPVARGARSATTSLASARTAAGLSLAWATLGMTGGVDRCWATEPRASVREGLRLYSKEKYKDAMERFAAAAAELEKRKSRESAVAAFDQACAYHRNGELAEARENYLRAGLSQDRTIAVASHFNLGTLAAEQAREEAGQDPESVEVEKRSKILEQLMQAAAAYRHCLELQPDHAQSRSNLELVRQWIKYYSDRWQARDRQKRRDESTLIAFLQFVLDTQRALLETTKNLPPKVSADGFAELKRAQMELADETPSLKEKIEKELRPPSPGSPNSSQAAAPEDAKELEQAIRTLHGWADVAGENMSSAAGLLGLRDPKNAASKQQAAIDELERIWDAVIPFHPLLARDLADQTAIVSALESAASDVGREQEKSDVDPAVAPPSEPKTEPPQQPPQAVAQNLQISDDYVKQLTESQERTLRKSRLLVPKAEMELKQLESRATTDGTMPSTKVERDGNDGKNQSEQQDQPNDKQVDGQEPMPAVDPEEMKAGYRKAIELGPQAVEQMESVLRSLRQTDVSKAAASAREAKHILQEIQDAQPKNKLPPDQQQDKDQQPKKDPDKNQDEKNQQGQNEPSPTKQDSQPQKEQNSQSKQDQPRPEPELSRDRIEEALRQVRERQEDKRDRDRQLKGKILGRTPVDKDW